VSGDTDFANALRFPPGSHPGIVVLRVAARRLVAWGRLAGKRAQKLRQVGLGHLASSDLVQSKEKDVVVLPDPKAVHVEEGDGRKCGCSLVAVEERLRLADVECIRRCHRKDVDVEVDAVESRLRLRDRGTERPLVADAVRPRPALQTDFVRFEHVLKCQKEDHFCAPGGTRESS
jgi:hypothetical protein